MVKAHTAAKQEQYLGNQGLTASRLPGIPYMYVLSQEVKGHILYSHIYIKRVVITSEIEANEAKG